MDVCHTSTRVLFLCRAPLYQLYFVYIFSVVLLRYAPSMSHFGQTFLRCLEQTAVHVVSRNEFVSSSVAVFLLFACVFFYITFRFVVPVLRHQRGNTA